MILNGVLRLRHRCLYLQGCSIILLVSILFLAFITRKPILLSTRQNSDVQPTIIIRSTLAVSTSITSVVTLSQELSTQPQERIPTIFAITPTRKRRTQLLDLTNLCQTLMNIEHVVWIVVESYTRKSLLVSDLLNSCKVDSVHLLSSMYDILTKTNDTTTQSGLKRGAKERNMGIQWLRQKCIPSDNCSGVVYFMDDESKYDLRLFEEMRSIQHVGVWPVAFSGKMKFQGPVCINNSIVEWHAPPAPVIPFATSGIGYAINLHCLLDNSSALFGYKPKSHIISTPGWEESDFLRNFVTGFLDPNLECRGSDIEAYVWQVKSEIDPYLRKHRHRWRYKIRT